MILSDVNLPCLILHKYFQQNIPLSIFIFNFFLLKISVCIVFGLSLQHTESPDDFVLKRLEEKLIITDLRGIFFFVQNVLSVFLHVDEAFSPAVAFLCHYFCGSCLCKYTVCLTQKHLVKFDP